MVIKDAGMSDNAKLQVAAASEPYTKIVGRSALCGVHVETPAANVFYT
jgi:hypothetical protein